MNETLAVLDADFLNKINEIRKANPDSAIVWFPYDVKDGVYQYPQSLMDEMEQFLLEKIKEYIPENKIFRWGNEDE